jgi:TonB family protein
MFFMKFDHASSTPREYIEIVAFDFIEPPREQPVSPVVRTTLTNEQLPINVDEIQAPAIDSPPAQDQPDDTSAQQIDVPRITIPDMDPVDISQLPDRIERTRPNIQRPAAQDTLMRPVVTSPILLDTPHTTPEGQVPQGHGISLDGFADEIRNQAGHLSQYRLDGDVVNRMIVNRVIPDFPEGVNRNGSVTMEFTVVPNGSVQNITVTRRSEPEFETVSLVALRQWTFNRSDRSHTGQITFNFRLE